ncbi:MAG: UDP-glucose 4-epimerase GalE [Saprospiraceae bacterium]
MKNKILVSGGLGFIGSHTVVELIKEGYEVVIIDDLSNSQMFILDHIEKIVGVRPTFYEVSLLEKDKLDRIFKEEEHIAGVIHFAASKAVGESVLKPLKYFKNNLCSLINLLECMEQSNTSNIVFSSSATVYGDADILPITEQTSFKKALSAYGSTKQMGEEILEKVGNTGNVNCISLRYFNPVGAHESGLLGELPIGIPNNLMPFITQTAAGLRDELIVFGDDYDTSDGTCIRDYVHVVDLAKAHVKSCERLIDDKVEQNYEVYNIGTGNGSTTLEVINNFEKYNDIKLNYRIGNRREGDSPSTYADVSYAKIKLNWEATLGIKEMVTSAWNWQKILMKRNK